MNCTTTTIQTQARSDNHLRDIKNFAFMIIKIQIT